MALKVSMIKMEKKTINCKSCDHSWTIDKSDTDPYFCHMCGFDNEKNEYNIPKLSNWWGNQKLSLKKISEMIFKINKHKN
jgi:ribosomal protein L37AE/L43A